ncbi:FtsX-like permease family protein [Paraclostridium ghonii]|uniref:ABC transporter permease n=1 Tax=Paraclostridium ghonii TaxID=29358 RepID=UPI00202CF0A6|nr:FtsX-like permease family protein [Paeniclostridium ghonii]
MWLAKLKRKKSQYSLLGVIFTIAISLICVSTVIIGVSKTFALNYYMGDSTPDIQVITLNDSVVNKTDSWFKSKGEKVRNYKKSDMFSVSTNLSFNNKENDNLMSYVVPMKSMEGLSNKMEIVEGDKTQKSPRKGEIWISATTANLNNIKVGDKAKIVDNKGKTHEYKVSAIINDSNQASTSVGILYVYVNEYERYTLSSLPYAKMITMNCDGDSSKVSQELVDYINEPIGGFILDKSLYIISAMTATSLLGGLSLMAAIVLAIVLILILKVNVKNNILKEYKSIGIYKCMGYSSKKIRSIYLYSYGVVSIISSLIGLLIAIPLVSYICNIAFKNLGEYKFDLMSLGIMITVLIIFNLIVYITLFISLKCINKIKPVEAINIGLTSSKEKLKKSLIKNNSSSLCMAINDIFKYKKNNFIILIIFVLVFYMSTLFLNISYTMLNLDSELYEIFGTANADMVISAPSDIEDSIKEIKEYIDKDDRVENYYLWDVVAKTKVGIDSKKYDVVGGMVAATVYNEFNEKDFSILQGMNPRNNKEVSVSLDIMKRNNLKIGDYITLNVEGKNKEFLIVGIYKSMMNGGQSVRLTNDALEGESNGNIAFVKLKNIDDYENLKKDIDNKFDSIIIDKVYEALKDAASQVVETSVPISIILLVGVLIFGIVNIVNILITNNLDNRRNYGIMKSLGFTSQYIKRRNNYRIMILAVVGALIGVGITRFTSSKLLEIALGFNIFDFNTSMTLGLVGITFVLIILTMYICNKSINKISTVDLIKE